MEQLKREAEDDRAQLQAQLEEEKAERIVYHQMLTADLDTRQLVFERLFCFLIFEHAILDWNTSLINSLHVV